MKHTCHSLPLCSLWHLRHCHGCSSERGNVTDHRPRELDSARTRQAGPNGYSLSGTTLPRATIPSLEHCFKDRYPHFLDSSSDDKDWASLVVQWPGIRLPVQGTRGRSLVGEDSTGQRATKCRCHNYRKLRPLEPVLCNSRSHCGERPMLSASRGNPGVAMKTQHS